MKTEELLRLEEIRKSYGPNEVLRGINLVADKGKFITILGASGCGKTTLLRLIAGLEEPGSGRIFLNGRDISADEPHRRNVPMVFQSYALFPHMNVEANIGYSLRLKRAGKGEIKKAVAEVLDLVRLSGFEKRMPSQLSGGQKQRVAVARALVMEPPVLLLDEPLGALDLQLRRQMQTELKRLQEQLGITFIYITHDQEEALTMSDTVAVMRNGLFEQTGSPAEIYNAPATTYVARFVGNANILKDHSAPGQCIAVRSEHVEFVAAGNSGKFPGKSPGMSPGTGGGIPARIISRSFEGGQIRFTALMHNGGEITACRQGIDLSLENGTEVEVIWPADKAIPLRDTD